MSEQAVLWLFGILISVIFGLIAVIWNSVKKRLDAIDSGALASFLAKDTERERQWMFWRDEVNKRLDAHAEASRGNTERIIRLERNGH